ncbi:hypothetical protein HVTV-2_gp113 [Haloarcula virus HVTV-2]|uniref:Uncharacterized protein n=1 Tax=Haloarcula vallismortis tailed virus 1 TaxID=1262528 RepID=L7TNQ7_9CAUD|nr:hypothetical protein HVTV1_113 [Haloarcula vallismortis tailed virus 1]AGC34482.1 hypothetical protein HVTV1_113 [Haloarcula vallismortis tailed virus 1]UBF22920.1 hypothetical protein HVTV-2_gp113 [Haloarcula virus HVTV-2]
MSEPIEIRENVRVYIRTLDEAPESVDLEVADEDDPGEYYYEVPLDELGKRLGKRYIRYDGPEGRGFFDTARGELRTRPRGDDRETNENTVKNKIFEKADRILDKYKIYISDADTRAEAEQMAPEWADVQVTEQGAFYYEKLPGQGGDDGLDEDELEVGDYDVDTTFGKIVADRVNNDDVGDIPVDDFHEYMDQIEDEELIKDCLQAEIDGPGRKTGKQFIEQRARALDIDLDLFYKDTGPDKTGKGGITSLSEVEIDVDQLSSEVVVSAEDNPHTTEDWSVQKMYEYYIEEGNPMPAGMGAQHDIPGGTMTTVLEEHVDDPAVLMQFYNEGGLQQRRDVRDILEEKHGVIAKVETVDSQYRFDLDGMQEYMTEEEVQELSEGDAIVFDDFAGGFMEGEVVEVRNAGIEVKGPHGGTQEIPLTNVFTPEYYLASQLEKDGINVDAGLLDWTAPDGIIEQIEDDSVLSRALQWDEDGNDMDLRPETVQRINGRLTEVSPPDPEEYGMTEESMNLLHGATWPEWDDTGRKQGTGMSDDLARVYEDATTDDLKNYLEVCEDNDLDQRADVVRGMLYYREDGDTDVWDIFEYERTAHGNYSGATEDTADRIKVGAEMTMDNLEPHVGAQLAGHIERFELQMPPDGSNWAGQSQSGGRTMAIDDPYNVEKTTSHEMGHAFHNFLGIKNDGYGTIDNRDNANDPMSWKFGANAPSNDNDAANEFYEDMKNEWEAYKKTMAGESDDANEIRSYQKRHGVELMAVGFAHWNMDPYKLRTRHPGLAKAFDKHLGDGIVDPISPSEVEEEQYYEIAREGTGRVTAQVQDVEEDGGVTSFYCKIVEGPREGRSMWFSSEDSVFEAKSDEWEPVDFSHGMKYTVELGHDDPREEVYIDRDTRVMGGDFMVRDSMGNPVGQWTESQLEDNLVDRSGEEGEIPWSADQAEKGDLVEMHGVEVNVRDVDDFNNELVLEDAQGEKRTLSFDEVSELRQKGDFEPVSNVVDWDEITSNNSYQFVADDARYNGTVVGIEEGRVQIEQSHGGTSYIERDEIEEVRRRA